MESKGDITISLEDVSNVSSLNAKQVIRGIHKSNIIKSVFGQLNINSLRNKIWHAKWNHKRFFGYVYDIRNKGSMTVFLEVSSL